MRTQLEIFRFVRPFGTNEKKIPSIFCFLFEYSFIYYRGTRKQGIEFIQKQKAFIKLVCSRRLGAATFVFAIMKEIIKGGN